MECRLEHFADLAAKRRRIVKDVMVELDLKKLEAQSRRRPAAAVAV